MTAFRVWAPFATRVELQLGDSRRRMTAGDGGWWRVEAADAPPGTDYAYFVDGEGPFPDPRSPWQPNGVHAASRLVDHAAFAWQHDEWPRTPLSEAIIYELHVGTFTPRGTFESAVEKLDYLVELGVTHVELMPVAQFPGERGWGYDGVDLFAPHQAYGGPDGLKRFVDACHGRGLRVLLDVVYNHLGPSGNYLERFGPYFTERYHTPWGKAINYDQAYADEVRRFVVDNALMWLRDYRCDGLRLDAVHAILDQSAVHILEQIATKAHALERETGRLYDVIAESDLNDPRLVTPVPQGGYGLDAAWSDDFHHAVHALLTGERAGYYEDFGSVGALAEALQHVYVYRGGYSSYRKRSHGRPAVDLPGWRFVFAVQNHDQIGNRARGERLVHLTGITKAKVAAALLLTAAGVPLLFQGEEWAATSPFQYFTDHQEPDLARAVSEGRKREFAAFGWWPDEVPDPQDLATFERSRLDWAERDRESHREMLSWYRDLIALRRSTPELTDGRLAEVEVSYDEGARTLTMRRGSIMLCLNLGPETVLEVPPSKLLITSDPGADPSGRGLSLPPDSVAILQIGDEPAATA
ncbi:MAG TPA: malto-oligosyltrehalose trehalohydrolase [Dehalococcoidia bacterium]|nr:malto-oligosyltrehalose trehalohydrolase [Dehalococcoidia bacterium]